MEMNGLRKRHKTSLTNDTNSINAVNDAGGTNGKRVKDDLKVQTQGKAEETVWGKTSDGTIFKVPTTHDVLTLFNPAYPKSHFDILSLFLLGSQIVIFLAFVYENRQQLRALSSSHPIKIQSINSNTSPRSPLKYWAQTFFLVYFVIWRLAYNLGLGIVLTKQSKKRWIVRYVKQQGWLDPARRPKVREWIGKQLSGKMGSDYDFDDLPVEYNTWLLFRQVVDIILLNDFVSYLLFSLCHLNIFFPTPSTASSANVFGSFVSHSFRFVGGVALLLFNLWVKTSAHDIVKDYGWYWGDCFFSRGHLRSVPTPHPSTEGTQDPSAPHTNTPDLQFDLVFDGIFEMAPHPMYSVGYAGYYGVSLIAASYPVLFVSLAAHACQFAFLNWFENPHIERRYGTRKALAERTPIPVTSRTRSSTAPTLGSHSREASRLALSALTDSTSTGSSFLSVNHSRARSASVISNSEDTTVIDSEEGSPEFTNGPAHSLSHNGNGSISGSAETILRANTADNIGDDTEIVREAMTQHDLLTKFFRKDVVVLSDIDWLRASDQKLLLLGFYAILVCILPSFLKTPRHLLMAHFFHALAWRIYYSVILGSVLKAQSDGKWLVKHYLTHYHYPANDRGEGAVKEAFENWKEMYNLGQIMCYLSFFGFALQTYTLPAASSLMIGDVLLRHVLGVLLIALHAWAARESYEVLGIFGWFYGDFFIDSYPSSLNYTGIYRFLNNPERTLSGASLFGLALMTGNVSVFVLAIVSHLSHWGFLKYVEGPHMQKLYGDSLRKDAGFTKMLKKVAKNNAKVFEGIHKQINIILEERAGKHAPELRKVAKGVIEVGERISDAYIEGSELVEEVWKRSKPMFSEVVADTKTLLQLSRERFVIPFLAADLADYDQSQYNMYVVPTNPEGQLRFHWGEPITIIWRSPMKHSRRDWIGIYRYGANKSQTMTKTNSFGLWVPVHDDEWDGDVPRPHAQKEETECGQVMFKNSTLPWQTGDFELRYHHDARYNVVALVGPIQIYMDRPDALDFVSIRKWLLKIVHLALDSDPELVPKSQVMPSESSQPSDLLTPTGIHPKLAAAPALSLQLPPPTSGSGSSSLSSSSMQLAQTSSSSSASSGYDIHDDDFKFWSERQAKRISYAISQVLGIEFAPEVIVADANVTSLTKRILASKELLGP